MCLLHFIYNIQKNFLNIPFVLQVKTMVMGRGRTMEVKKYVCAYQEIHEKMCIYKQLSNQVFIIILYT